MGAHEKKHYIYIILEYSYNSTPLQKKSNQKKCKKPEQNQPRGESLVVEEDDFRKFGLFKAF
jgi:hypothetical protein